jgi:hypothetical protein
MDRIQRLGDKDNFWQAGEIQVRVGRALRFTSIVDLLLALTVDLSK